MSQFFTSSHQSIGASASASVLPMIFRTDFLHNGLVGSPCSSRDSQESSPTPQFKILRCSALFMVHLLHPYMTTGKTIALTRQIFVDKVMSLLFNMLSRLVAAFLLRSKCLLVSWLQSPSPVILKPKKIKSLTLSIFPHHFMANRWGNNGNSSRFYFLGLKNHCRWKLNFVTAAMKSKDISSLEEKV